MENCENIIEIINLTKKYGDLAAVNDVSFNIKKGDFIGLLGHNGAGKTTLFTMLTGLSMQTSGTIKICGKDINKNIMKLKREISFLPDNTRLYENLTAKENLEYFCDLADSERSRVPELLKIVGMSKWINKKVGEFSKGMTQRLGIAQALIKNPKLIILDEPTSGLDPEARVSINGLLKKLNESGISIILSSHVLSEISSVCSKVAIMKNGKLVAFEEINELIKKQSNGEITTILETTNTKKSIQILKKIKSITAKEQNNKIIIISKTDIKKDLGLLLMKENISIISMYTKKIDLFNILEEFYK